MNGVKDPQEQVSGGSYQVPVPDRSAKTLREPGVTAPGEDLPREPAAALIERYGDLVYNLAVRLTGDREEARDLAQDACLLILKGAASFRGEASAKTWVCQIVINCHRNRSRWWRRLKRGRTVSLDERLPGAEDDDLTLGATVADPGPGADRIVEARQARRRLETELGRLPREQRAALILREVEGLSYAEIAAALGVREGTVKSRLARAREALRLAMIDLAETGRAGETT